jgi:hypothetical protein
MTDFAKSPRLEAADRGETTYRSERACKRGHDPLRYTADGQCVACCTDRSRARAEAIRQRLAAGRAAAQEST